MVSDEHLERLWLPVVWTAEWNSDGSMVTQVTDELSHRCWAHWRHAEHRLAGAATEFDLIDVVTTLKRAADQRVKFIADLYGLSAMKRVAGVRKARTLDMLAQLGIVRPLMVDKLFQLRNVVEHMDSTAPSHDECEELVEFVWYLLRTTDRLASWVLEECEFRDKKSGNSANVIYPLDTWMPIITVGLNKDLISAAPKDGYGEVLVGMYRDHGEHVFVRGIITGPDPVMWRLWSQYFDRGHSYPY